MPPKHWTEIRSISKKAVKGEKKFTKKCKTGGTSVDFLCHREHEIMFYDIFTFVHEVIKTFPICSILKITVKMTFTQ